MTKNTPYQATISEGNEARMHRWHLNVIFRNIYYELLDASEFMQFDLERLAR